MYLTSMACFFRTTSRWRHMLLLVLAFGVTACQQPGRGQASSADKDSPSSAHQEKVAPSEPLLTDISQLTFAGKRAGEGYFSADGTQLVFQSERQADNPFYQIYLMDLETGDIERVSPGIGKTTCAWIHPDGKKILFSSTHLDPQARQKQREELAFRASGKQRRYSWDYDENYDIFVRNGDQYRRLTTARGYDAEGSFSPDGQWVVFASNRRAYDGSMTAEEARAFATDPAALMDIYLMRADGSDVRRLTTALGYDGGPFFSPDGQRIVWRRFHPNGATAEIYSMNRDGSDKKQITHQGVMSWAPFYHPSGQYIIYTNNLNGFGNFELYIVDTEGRHEPVRVTFSEGFDGLPVFSPDGKQLYWTRRDNTNKGQIFRARWNHALALKKLGLSTVQPSSD